MFFGKITTKSQVVTNFNVTKLRLHCILVCISVRWVVKFSPVGVAISSNLWLIRTTPKKIYINIPEKIGFTLFEALDFLSSMLNHKKWRFPSVIFLKPKGFWGLPIDTIMCNLKLNVMYWKKKLTHCDKI